MKDVPVQYSYMGEEEEAEMTDGTDSFAPSSLVQQQPMDQDFMMRTRTPPTRRKTKSRALRLAQRIKAAVATESASVSVYKNDDDQTSATRRDEGTEVVSLASGYTGIGHDHGQRQVAVSPASSGLSNQENSPTPRFATIDTSEYRDPPPVADIILVASPDDDDGVSVYPDEMEITPIEQTYTNFMRQADYPADEEWDHNDTADMANEAAAAELYEDFSPPPPPTDGSVLSSSQRERSLSQAGETESVVSESSKHKNKLKLFRLFPGIVDAAARRKNKMAAARERRRILDEKRTGKPRKRSFLKRHGRADSDHTMGEYDLTAPDQKSVVSIPDETEQAQTEPLDNETVAALGDASVTDTNEPFEEEQNERMAAPATTEDRTETQTQKFTHEQVEQFVSENAASLAYVDLANFEALYDIFVSSLPNGIQQQEVQHQQTVRYTEDANQMDLSDEVHLEVTTDPTKEDTEETEIKATSSAPVPAVARSKDFEPTLPSASSILDLEQSADVEPQPSATSDRSIANDKSIDLSANEKSIDEFSQKSMLRESNWENSILESTANMENSILENSVNRGVSQPHAEPRKSVIGRAIKGRGRERKWFEAIGVKGRVKSLAIEIEPSNSQSTASVHEPLGMDSFDQHRLGLAKSAGSNPIIESMSDVRSEKHEEMSERVVIDHAEQAIEQSVSLEITDVDSTCPSIQPPPALEEDGMKLADTGVADIGQPLFDEMETVNVPVVQVGEPSKDESEETDVGSTRIVEIGQPPVDENEDSTATSAGVAAMRPPAVDEAKENVAVSARQVETQLPPVDDAEEFESNKSNVAVVLSSNLETKQAPCPTASTGLPENDVAANEENSPIGESGAEGAIEECKPDVAQNTLAVYDAESAHVVGIEEGFDTKQKPDKVLEAEMKEQLAVVDTVVALDPLMPGGELTAALDLESAVPSKKEAKQAKKGRGLSIFGKKTEKEPKGIVSPAAEQPVPMDKVLSTPSNVKKNAWFPTSRNKRGDEGKSLRRSVTYASERNALDGISTGDLVLPIAHKKVQDGGGSIPLEPVGLQQTTLDLLESRDVTESKSEDESSVVRQSLLDNDTFESFVSEKFEDEDDEDEDDVDIDDDSISLGGDCTTYSNFLDWVGRWILPLGGSRVCVPADEDRDIADYAPELKAVVSVGAENINSIGSQLQNVQSNPLSFEEIAEYAPELKAVVVVSTENINSNCENPLSSYEDLGKVQAGMCNDISLLSDGIKLIRKLDKKH